MSDDLKLSHKIIESSGLPSTSISSIYATRSALYHEIRTSHTAIPPDLIVLPPSLSPPPKDAADFLMELTACANAAATSAACGSIIAGHNSETDEFGDIAFWLGPGSYEQGNELAVFRALNLPVGSHPEVWSCVSYQFSEHQHPRTTDRTRGVVTFNPSTDFCWPDEDHHGNREAGRTTDKTEQSIRVSHKVDSARGRLDRLHPGRAARCWLDGLTGTWYVVRMMVCAAVVSTVGNLITKLKQLCPPCSERHS